MKNEVSDVTLAITTSESFETKFLLYRFVTILRSFSVHPLNKKDLMVLGNAVPEREGGGKRRAKPRTPSAVKPGCYPPYGDGDKRHSVLV